MVIPRIANSHMAFTKVIKPITRDTIFYGISIFGERRPATKRAHTANTL